MPSRNYFDLLIVRNRVFRLRNDQKYTVQSLKDLDMVITRDRVLTPGNVHISVFPPCYVVDLPILRNRVFMFRNVKKYE